MTDADLREVQLEKIRQAEFPARPSRLVCMLAALSVETAVRYASKFRAQKGAPVAEQVKIFEVFAERYAILDMHCLDLADRPDLMPGRYREYWAGQASYDSFNGVWREPLLESLLPLPVRIGATVHQVSRRPHSDEASTWSVALT